MPTDVLPRPGFFPVRVSLNITEQDSQALERLAASTGEPRAVLARAAFERGLPVLGDMYRKRRRRADPDGEDSEVQSVGGGREQPSSGASPTPARAG